MEKDELEARILNAKRIPRLEWYEREIEKRFKSFADIWSELRDDPLKPYLATHSSLTHYLEDRWGMTDRRQQQLAAAATVKQLLADAAPDLAHIVRNMKEGQVRELAKVPEAERPAVLRAAIADPKGKLTSTVIKQAKARVVGTTTNLPMHIPIKASTEDFAAELERMTSPVEIATRHRDAQEFMEGDAFDQGRKAGMNEIIDIITNAQKATK